MVERFKPSLRQFSPNIPSISTAREQAASNLFGQVRDTIGVAENVVSERFAQRRQREGRELGTTIGIDDLSEHNTNTLFDRSVRQAAVQASAVTLMQDITQETQTIATVEGLSLDERISQLEAAQRQRLQNTPEEAHSLVNKLYTTTGLSKIQNQEAERIKLQRQAMLDETDVVLGEAIRNYTIFKPQADMARSKAVSFDMQLEMGKITEEQHAELMSEIDTTSLALEAEASAQMRSAIQAQVDMGHLTPRQGEIALAQAERDARRDFGVAFVVENGPVGMNDLRNTGQFTEQELVEIANTASGSWSLQNSQREREENQQNDALRQAANRVRLSMDDAFVSGDIQAVDQLLNQFRSLSELTGDKQMVEQSEKLRDRRNTLVRNGGATPPEVLGTVERLANSGEIRDLDELPEEMRNQLSPSDELAMRERIAERQDQLLRSPSMRMAFDEVDRALPMKNNLTPVERAMTGQSLSQEDLITEQLRSEIKGMLQRGFADGSINQLNALDMVNRFVGDRKEQLKQAAANQDIVRRFNSVSMIAGIDREKALSLTLEQIAEIVQDSQAANKEEVLKIIMQFRELEDAN